MFDFHFDIEDSIVPALGPPRLTPEFFHLGKHDQDIEFADIAIRVARAPMAVNLRQYYEASQEQLPQFKSDNLASIQLQVPRSAWLNAKWQF